MNEDRRHVDAAEHVGEGEARRDGRQVDHHLHDRAAQLAADDLPRPQRGDGEQVVGVLFVFAGQRAQGAEGDDDQAAARPGQVVAEEHLPPLGAVPEARPDEGHAQDRPCPDGDQQQAEGDGELLALQGLAGFLHQDGIEPVADAPQQPADRRSVGRGGRPAPPGWPESASACWLIAPPPG